MVVLFASLPRIDEGVKEVKETKTDIFALIIKIIKLNLSLYLLYAEACSKLLYNNANL